MDTHLVGDIALGLLALLAGAVFSEIGEDAVAITLGVLGAICLATTLQRLSAQ